MAYSKIYTNVIELSVADSEKAKENENQMIDPTYKDIFCSLNYSKPLRLSLVFCLALNLTGMIFITYYSTFLFGKITDSEAAKILTVITGITELTSVLIMLNFIDRFGRKALTLIGAIGMAISLSFCALSDYFLSDSVTAIMIGICSYIFFFVVGAGNIAWLYMGEILTDRLQGICICFH